MAEKGNRLHLDITVPNNEALRATYEEAVDAWIQHVQVRETVDWGGQVALDNITGYKSVNKFGAAPSGVQDVATDIWDRADATPTQSVWTAPTQARVHAIVSTSGEDAVGGTGAAYLIVYGLTSWDTKEVSEVVTLTGVASVNTVNSYVIIHRMKCVAQASTTNVGVNVGTITATAAGDGTVTAAILPGNGQTEMAIYGVPSVQEALLYRWSVQIDKASGAVATADFILRVNENPDVQLLGFIRKDDISVQSTGTNTQERNYTVPPKFSGPCIIKVTAIASVDDVDGEAQFDLVLVDK